MVNSENWLAFARWWSREGDDFDITAIESQLKQNPIFATTMSLARSLAVVVDLRSMQILFVEGDIEGITGWDKESCMKGGVKYVFEKLDHEDQKFGALVGQLVQEYYKSLSESRRRQFRAYWDWRYVKPNGSSSRVLANDIILKHDQQGNMMVLLSLISEIGTKKGDHANHLRMTDGIENRIYEYVGRSGVLTELECPSNRELEVIRYVSKGLSREKIAAQLGISLATVKTHCNNTYKKLKTNDSVETVNLLQVLQLF